MNSSDQKPATSAKLWRAGSLICALVCAAAFVLLVGDKEWPDAVLAGGLGALFFYWWASWHRKP